MPEPGTRCTTAWCTAVGDGCVAVDPPGQCNRGCKPKPSVCWSRSCLLEACEVASLRPWWIDPWCFLSWWSGALPGDSLPTPPPLPPLPPRFLLFLGTVRKQSLVRAVLLGIAGL